LLRRSNFDVDHVPNARSAVDLVRLIGFDVLVLGYPPVGPTLDELLDLVRAKDSPCRRSAVLILAPRDRLTEVEPSLGRGYTRALATDAPDAELQKVVASLLRVSPRLAVRVTVRLQVQLADGQTELMSQTENVSSSGLLVRARRSYPVETAVQFELYLPGESVPVSGRGMVVRQATDRGGRVTGLGVKFAELFASGEPRLNAFLDRHRPGGP
jgi:hypothetical protein